MGSSGKEQWRRRTLDPALQARAQRGDAFATESGLDVDAVYADDDLRGSGFDHQEDLGNPGEYPFTRGVQPTMYRGRLWTMRQYSGYATAEESNRRYRYLLEQGQTGLSVAFDLPTQIGYDSDHPLARGEVGKVGVPICHLEDMETLLEGIPLDKVSTSMTINATASVLLCLYAVVAKEAGRSPFQHQRHPSERHSQGVHRQRHVHLPAPTLHAAGGGRVQVLLRQHPPLEHHQRQRLPHAGGRRDGGTGAGLHLRERHRIRSSGGGRGTGRGRIRWARVVLLRVPQQHLRGGGQVPGGPEDVGEDNEGAFPRPQSPLHAAAVSHPDGGRNPHSAAAQQQRSPHHAAGPCRRSGGHPVPSRELSGRSSFASLRGVGADISSHPADPSPRDGAWPTWWTRWAAPTTWKT